MATRKTDWAAWAGSAARTTGCALAPPSRVEEFKEVIVLCGMGSGMQDVCRAFHLFFSGLSRITCWRRQALKIMLTLCDTCVTSCWHTDVCGHPPPHSPVTARRLHQWEKKPSISSCSSGVWSRQRGTVDRNCHLKIYQTNVQLITSVECGYQQKQGYIQWAFTIWWMQSSW